MNTYFCILLTIGYKLVCKVSPRFNCLSPKIMKTFIYLQLAFLVIGHLKGQSLNDQLQDLKLLASDQLTPESFNPQTPLSEIAVKKSTTSYKLHPTDITRNQRSLSDILIPENVQNLLHIDKRDSGFKNDYVGAGARRLFLENSLDSDYKASEPVKRSIGDRFGNLGDGAGSKYDNFNGEESELWDPTFTGKNEGTVIKNLMQQDSLPSFGTSQEARDEMNTIQEIERLSRQSSVLPQSLKKLQYINGDSDNLEGLDFNNMDISVGKFNSDFDNHGDDSRASFLRRNSVPVKAHKWQNRNRDQIPRHHIEGAAEDEQLSDLSSYHDFAFFPKLSRYPSAAAPDRITPLREGGLEPFAPIPPIAPALISREQQFPREPVPPREGVPLDEPPPVSEFIQSKEPAPIPELPSLREIPPISEQREPAPEDLNPKETFGS